MLVVLGNLNPAERIAFVLHDVFALSFSEISNIVGRNETATRQLASRARGRVQGAGSVEHTEEHKHKQELVEAFLAASRTGNFEKLLLVLDPNVVLHNDTSFAPVAGIPVVHGASAVAKQFSGRAQGARAVLIDGSVGIIVAPRGRMMFALKVIVVADKITEIEMIADKTRLSELDMTVISNE
ncbi:sigma factor-like helix-turn-helix DNA-binding protein [Paenibacillus radicibacter]|uniref:sigma factor-like helix-turn-helix DNA-binding protein n=1 Tax=Paenibacillus radicibacter TaxID=2972488 RepID=UPI00280BB4BC|nr:sigma factor-like helix-turn-helix DNA-binding protein [Paenibacillus radicibacter]